MYPKISAILGYDILEESQNRLDKQRDQLSFGCHYVLSLRRVVGIGADGQ
jgi:hypothetical protein